MAATPNRERKLGTQRDPHDKNLNSWERGIAKDEYGLPFLNANLTPVGVKEFAQKRNSGAWDHPGRVQSSATTVGRRQ